MRKPFDRLRAAALLVAVGLLAAGCSDQAKPPTPPATADTVAAGPKDPKAATTRGGMTDVKPGMAGIPK